MESSSSHFSPTPDSLKIQHACGGLQENSNINSNCTKPLIKHSSLQDNRKIIQQLSLRIFELEEKLTKLESRGKEQPKKKKKIRRRAKEVPRMFVCSISNCGKQYGSEASLRNHKKLKHGIRLFRTFKLKMDDKNKNNLQRMNQGKQ